MLLNIFTCDTIDLILVAHMLLSSITSRDHLTRGALTWHVCCSLFLVWLSAAEAYDDDGGAGSGTGLGGSARN